MRHVQATSFLLPIAFAMFPVSIAHADAPTAAGYDIEELTDPALDAPRGLVLDEAGNAYTFEHFTGEVLKIAADASTLIHFASLGAETWTGIAYDKSSKLLYVDKYVAGEIVAVNVVSGDVTTVVTGLISEGTGGLASDGNGILYVTQWPGVVTNCPADVLRFDMTATPPTQTTYADDQVCYPDGPTVAPDGIVYVAERGYHMIRRIDPDTGLSSVLIDAFTFPANVSATADGHLLVPDTGTGTIYRIDPQNPAANVVGTGFGEAYAAVEDADGRIYVASMDLNAIYRLTPTTAGDCAGAPNGTPCDDGMMCLTSDSCQAGVCVGVDAGTCVPLPDFTIDEGTNHAFAGSVDAPPGGQPSYVWSFGNGPTAQGWTASYAFPDNGTFTVTFAANSSGGSTSDTAEVTVNNVAPTITSTPSDHAQEAQQYTYMMAFTDPGTADTHTCSAPVKPAGSQLANCTLTWTPDFSQAIGASIPIRTCVTDDDGGQACQDFTVTVSFLDSDHDSLPDSWEISNFSNITSQDQFGDPDGDGMNNLQEFTNVTDPLTYDGPNAPVPSAPACGIDVASLSPTLVATNATDPQGTPLSYHFQVFSDPGMTVLVATTPPEALVAQGAGGTTAWTVPVNLIENTRYYWRVRARDQFTFGPYSAPACSFFVNTTNDAPASPSIVSPTNGATIDEQRPELVIKNATDADEDPLVYDWDLTAASDTAFAAPIQSAQNAPPQGSENTTFRLNADLEAGKGYCWRVRSDDGQAQSDYVKSCFTVSSSNAPPVAANDSATVEVGKSVTINVTANDTDPENQLDLGSVTIVKAGDLGTQVVNSDGTVTYTAATAAGQDTFTYTIKDVGGAVSNVATVTITVTEGSSAVCGDGVLAASEECDDGNHAKDDGCDSCSVEHGWTCSGSPSACEPRSGDGLVVGDEECDDGNREAGDGCAPTGVVENGWTCSGEPSHCNRLPMGPGGCSSGPLESGTDVGTLVMVGLAVVMLGRRGRRRAHAPMA